MSCDMFYVEVLLDPDGRVRDVKVELAGDQNAHEGLVSVCRTVMFSSLRHEKFNVIDVKIIRKSVWI